MTYTVNGQSYNFDSPVNDRIVQQFIDREVYCCASSEIDYILLQLHSTSPHEDEAPFTYEEYLGALSHAGEPECSDCGSTEFEEWDPATAPESDFQGEDAQYTCPYCGQTYETLPEARACCSHLSFMRCKSCGTFYDLDDYNALDSKFPEVFEWYIVSSYLGDKLKAHGQVVIDGWGKSYWGRQCTGQSLSLDGVFQSICYENEILQGQAYSWADKE